MLKVGMLKVEACRLRVNEASKLKASFKADMLKANFEMVVGCTRYYLDKVMDCMLDKQGINLKVIY